MRILVRLLLDIALILGLTAAAVVGSAVWFATRAPTQTAAVIIVLGGDMTRENTLGSQTRGRVETGVALFQASAAPRILFTGGRPGEGQPGPGDQMRALAISLGVPESATMAENASQSTLQNALMSRPVLGPLADEPVMLVTDGFHLARAWASFRWAGYGPIRLTASSAFGDQPLPQQMLWVGRETLAWWFNLGRVLAYEVVTLLKGPDPARIDMLR